MTSEARNREFKASIALVTYLPTAFTYEVVQG